MDGQGADIKNKQVFVVLGVGRSGTSAIARSLKVLGIDLGHTLRPKNDTNPKGFFEDSSVLSLNRMVARSLNNPWMNVSLLDDSLTHTDTVFAQFASHAAQILQNRLSRSASYAFKDPRTIILLPFWQQAFTRLQLDDRYIISIRHPLAAAYSGQKFSQHDLEMVMLMWLANIVAAMNGTEQKKRVVVSYESMLQDPLRQLERIKSALHVSAEINQAEADEYANQFLDKNLRHYSFDDAALHTHPLMQIAPLCMRVYQLLLQLANDDLTDEAFRAEWTKVNAEFSSALPLYRYVHTLMQRNIETHKELSTIHKSVPWALTRPLRYIEQLLRGIKKKSRDQRRLAKVALVKEGI